VLTEDESFDKDEPQNFNENYAGGIAISIGKIAAATKMNEEW
jgi:hypothetical protein